MGAFPRFFIMGWIENTINSFQGLSSRIDNIGTELGKIVSENKGVLLNLNRDQLLSGRNNEGELLGPTYLNDPYFLTREAAESYSKMKYRLESEHRSMLLFPQIYPSKPKDVPNLIVTGAFQNTMFIRTSADSFEIDATYKEARDINQKYDNKVYGIAPPSVDYFFRQYIKERLKNFIYGM